MVYTGGHWNTINISDDKELMQKLWDNHISKISHLHYYLSERCIECIIETAYLSLSILLILFLIFFYFIDEIPDLYKNIIKYIKSFNIFNKFIAIKFPNYNIKLENNINEIICINSTNYIELTLGKIYNIIEKNNYYYLIKDDTNNMHWFSKYLFKSLALIKKVICIDDKDWLYITTGKTYYVFKENNDNYCIINNLCDYYHYPKKYFMPLSEIRIEKINKLLEDESSMYR